jgi:hypothetical protein
VILGLWKENSSPGDLHGGNGGWPVGSECRWGGRGGEGGTGAVDEVSGSRLMLFDVGAG